VVIVCSAFTLRAHAAPTRSTVRGLGSGRWGGQTVAALLAEQRGVAPSLYQQSVVVALLVFEAFGSMRTAA